MGMLVQERAKAVIELKLTVTGNGRVKATGIMMMEMHTFNNFSHLF